MSIIKQGNLLSGNEEKYGLNHFDCIFSWNDYWAEWKCLQARFVQTNFLNNQTAYYHKNEGRNEAVESIHIL